MDMVSLIKVTYQWGGDLTHFLDSDGTKNRVRQEYQQIANNDPLKDKNKVIFIVSVSVLDKFIEEKSTSLNIENQEKNYYEHVEHLKYAFFMENIDRVRTALRQYL